MPEWYGSGTGGVRRVVLTSYLSRVFLDRPDTISLLGTTGHVIFMTLRTAVYNSFSLLRKHPRLFLPRLAMTLVWSGFWILLVRMLRDPYEVVLQDIFLLSATMLALVPFQIAVYNGYYVMVKQYRKDSIRMSAAFRQGLRKLPQSLAVFALLGTMSLVFGMPGAILFLYGTLSGAVILQVAGLGLSGVAVLGVMLIAYFAPISVVIGEGSFFENVKRGVNTSRQERREIAALTLLSFATLLLTQLLRGGFEYLGILGFFGGRFIAAVLSVYVLVVNPELFLQAESKNKDG